MKLIVKRICVPTDFSEAADHAVHYAAALAEMHGAALHLLHVIEHAGPLVHHPDFTGGGEIARAYFNQLDQAAADAEKSGEEKPIPELLQTIASGASGSMESLGKPWWENLTIHRDIRYGNAAKEINHYVEKHEIDLVVMGTHGHSKLATVLLGSVTERTVRTCSCPVTVIRHPEHQYEVTEE